MEFTYEFRTDRLTVRKIWESASVFRGQIVAFCGLLGKFLSIFDEDLVLGTVSMLARDVYCNYLHFGITYILIVLYRRKKKILRVSSM